MKKSLLTILCAACGTAGAIAGAEVVKRTKEGLESDVNKFKCYYYMLNRWLLLKQENKSLEKYFIDNGYETIAIYGMGELGNRLYEELKDTSIKVKYAIDQNVLSTYSELEVKEKDSSLEKVDAMIVTAVYAYDEIREEMSKKIDFPIISLEDVIYEL